MNTDRQVEADDANHAESRARIDRVLGIDKKNGVRRWRRRIILVLMLAGLIAGGGYLWKSMTYSPPPSFKTETVGKGDLTIEVTATGTVEPHNSVEVGTEISGLISKVYVDYNDTVRKGQVLAELDKAYLKAVVQQAEANMAAAKARYREALATAKDAELQAGRGKELFDKGISSRADYDSLQSTLESAQASAANAEAQITVAQAALDSANTNLRKATIRSPINGVVLSRSVEPGQAVAAAMQTPVLFEIAEDLKLMELHANVDEADVGQLQPGQRATFTVDAYPDRVFEAVLREIHNTPTEADNVVTYETILTVDNPDLALRPGMTSRVNIVVETVKGALLVPTAAFRFQPDGETAAKPGNGKSVWVLRKGRPVNVRVHTGSTDGNFTAVTSDELQVGDEVLTGAQSGHETSTFTRHGLGPF